MAKISFNLVKNAFATRKLELLAIRITFYNILAWAFAEIKNLRCVWTRRSPIDDFRLFDFWIFPPLLFLLFFLFAAMIDLPLGLLAVKKLLRKSHQGGQFLPWSS